MEETQIMMIEVNDRNEETEFLRKITQKGILTLKPSLEKQGIRYLDAEEIWKVDATVARKLLNGLVEKGLLKSDLVDYVLTCPHCDSPHVYSKYTCPKCKSPNVEFTELMEHTKCGNIGSRGSFTKDNSLVCPRCRLELGKKANEYRVIGNFYQCEACGNRFDKPDVIHICKNCGNVSTYQNAKYVKIFAYRVTEEAMKSFSTELPILENVKKTLAERGFTVQFHAKVTGISGVQSLFDVVAQKGTIRLVIDVSTIGNRNDIIALLAKKVDVMPSGTAIIDLSGSDEIANLGKVFGITIFKVLDRQSLPEDFEAFLERSSSDTALMKPTRVGGG